LQILATASVTPLFDKTLLKPSAGNSAAENNITAIQTTPVPAMASGSGTF
jgi:hypothetical protein